MHAENEDEWRVKGRNGKSYGKGDNTKGGGKGVRIIPCRSCGFKWNMVSGSYCQGCHSILPKADQPRWGEQQFAGTKGAGKGGSKGGSKGGAKGKGKGFAEDTQWPQQFDEHNVQRRGRWGRNHRAAAEGGATAAAVGTSVGALAHGAEMQLAAAKKEGHSPTVIATLEKAAGEFRRQQAAERTPEQRAAHADQQVEKKRAALDRATEAIDKAQKELEEAKEHLEAKVEAAKEARQQLQAAEDEQTAAAAAAEAAQQHKAEQAGAAGDTPVTDKEGIGPAFLQLQKLAASIAAAAGNEKLSTDIEKFTNEWEAVLAPPPPPKPQDERMEVEDGKEQARKEGEQKARAEADERIRAAQARAEEAIAAAQEIQRQAEKDRDAALQAPVPHFEFCDDDIIDDTDFLQQAEQIFGELKSDRLDERERKAKLASVVKLGHESAAKQARKGNGKQ